MKIGTYYYPEQWPREQWERDLDRIAAMGLKIVHMAEFAWFDLEPSPKDFRLDWLSDCVEMCRQRGLDVILCTPTAAPPVWLSDQFPEVLITDEHGTPHRHGGRRHYTPTSPRMQEASYRIVEAMATRFGHHPSVIGWQIDNELSGPFDQSEATHKSFRKWLRKKYLTIDALNAAWGNPFWNTYYQDFDQILMPQSRDPGYRNQHQNLDASRFWSWAWADFVKLQADALKRSFPAGRPAPFITTNFMPFHPDADPNDMRDSLDLWSWDSYPVSGFGRDFKDEQFRFGDMASIQFTHDQMASYNGRWALLEIQPGQINWSGFPCQPYPGAVRLWLWTAIAHGCELITVYRFRQPRFGIEMWHAGLIGLDGVTPTSGGEQFAQVATEAAKVWPDAHPTSIESNQPSAGLLLDFDQQWNFTSLGQAKRWNYSELLCQYHQALSRMGYRVRVLHPNEPWPSDLKLIVAPGVQMVDDALLARWQRYVDAGGHLVLTCRTGLQDRDAQFFETAYGAKIANLIGADISAYDSLPEETWGTIDLDGKAYKWGVWGDQLKPAAGTDVWASYTNMFYTGAHAITHRKQGSGSVTYNGVYGDRALAEAVIEKLARTIGNQAVPHADRVRVLERDGFFIVLNYTDQPTTAPAPADATFVVGSRELPPAGVAVWK